MHRWSKVWISGSGRYDFVHLALQEMVLSCRRGLLLVPVIGCRSCTDLMTCDTQVDVTVCMGNTPFAT